MWIGAIASLSARGASLGLIDLLDKAGPYGAGHPQPVLAFPNHLLTYSRLVGRDHLLDGGFSAADIGIGQALYMARHFARTEDFPALSAWYARVTARKGFTKALPPKSADLLYKRDFYEAWDG